MNAKKEKTCLPRRAAIMLSSYHQSTCLQLLLWFVSDLPWVALVLVSFVAVSAHRILLCRMFPHPRSKSHLARPESSEISEMLWRTITCLKNAVDVLLAAKWLGSFLSSLNSMAAETLDVVKMLLFLEDDDVPQQQEPVGQARCISQHQSMDGIHQLKDLKVGLGAIPFERRTLFGKICKGIV